MNFKAEEQLLGSHSIRKFASTHARRCGISKDKRDSQGRWKGKGRASDRYDDVELPYPDAKVADRLCIGRPCFYLTDNAICNSYVLTAFILTKVVPSIRQQLPDSAAIVLGRAMLWVVYSSVACNHRLTEYRDKVKSDLADTGIQVGEGQNPIIKMPVIVSGDQGTVYIDELQPMPGGVVVENGGPPDAAMNVLDIGAMRDLNVRMLNKNQASGNQLENWMLQLQSGFMTLRRENIELRSEISAMMLALERGFHIVNGNVRRVALQPVA
jgi:hypothetical protein